MKKKRASKNKRKKEKGKERKGEVKSKKQEKATSQITHRSGGAGRTGRSSISDVGW